MTDHFEVHDRDAAARRGELRLEDPVTTPAVVGREDVGDPESIRERIPTVLRDAGSLWAGGVAPADGDAESPGGDADAATPDGDDSVLTILPHRGFPAGTDEAVMAAFAPEYPDVDFPSAAVVTPETATDVTAGADAYVLAGAQGAVGHGEALRDAVVAVREAVPPDTALYLPGVATPANLPLLVYAGVDLVDADRAVVAGTRGRYLTTDGERRLEDLVELPCACPACRQPREAFDREDCVAHNVDVLAATAATLRERVREGRLRDYVEGQVRFEPWLTAGFREFDEQWSYLEARTPVVRDRDLNATTGDAIRRVEIRRFADRVTSRYRNRFRHPLVLVPCSAVKPYGESQSHGQFHGAIDFRAHKVSMTSPIGVVPQELELTYPAQHYDAAVTGRWTDDEVGFVSEVLERYLRENDYPRVVAHVPPDGYREVCERVEAALDVPFEYTVTDHPTTGDSLAALREALDGELKYARRQRRQNTVKAVADYQFGEGAGDELFGECEVTGPYPKHRLEVDGEQVAALVPQYGTFALTLAGGRLWVEGDVATKRVEIDDFAPHGSVLAPGVVDADESIRVGDEVVVEGPAAFAVGRARMFGREMAASTRGVAVDVRHVAEK